MYCIYDSDNIKNIKMIRKNFHNVKIKFYNIINDKIFDIFMLCYIKHSRKISDLIFMQEIRNIDNIKY